MSTALVKPVNTEKISVSVSTTSLDGIPPLGVPRVEKRYWWQRAKPYDSHAIATQVNILERRPTLEDGANTIPAKCV